VGVLLIDELWVLGDIKVHHFRGRVSAQARQLRDGDAGGRDRLALLHLERIQRRARRALLAKRGSAQKNGVTFKSPTGKAFVQSPRTRGLRGSSQTFWWLGVWL